MSEVCDQLFSLSGLAISAGVPIRLARRLQESGRLRPSFNGPGGALFEPAKIRELIELAAAAETPRTREFYKP